MTRASSVPPVGPRRAVIVHGVRDGSRPDEQDTLRQAGEAARSLARLGYAVETLALSLDLGPLARLAGEDTIVFNLVEALDGNGRLQNLPLAVLEHLGVAFTGAGSAAMAVTTDKVLAKRLLACAGLPVPETADVAAGIDPRQLYIVKSLTEDASFGLDAGSVVAGAAVAAEIASRRARFGGAWFAERYIEGREFNISVIEDETGAPRVLPVAEIVFVGDGSERPRIVDYAAKWDPASEGYNNTPRRFVGRDDEPALVAELERLTKAAWTALGLGGYARVDFRVDTDGRCYILEANANPCLSSDAGFAAAVAQAGMSFDEAIAMIVAAGLRRADRDPTAWRAQDAAGRPRKRAKIAAGEIAWRDRVTSADEARVRELVALTGFFTAEEIEIAAELVRERLARGAESGYEFVLAEMGGKLAGYACHGPIAGSDVSHDLYWIAVHPELFGRGIGEIVLRRVEEAVRAAGGRLLYADTSSSGKYAATRAFYTAQGFRQAAVLADFYRAGDGKVVFEKRI